MVNSGEQWRIISTTDQVFDIPQMAEYLNAPAYSCRRLLVAEKVKAAKVGNSWRVLRSEIDAFLRGDGPGNAEPGNGNGAVAEAKATTA